MRNVEVIITVDYDNKVVEVIGKRDGKVFRRRKVGDQSLLNDEMGYYSVEHKHDLKQVTTYTIKDGEKKFYSKKEEA